MSGLICSRFVACVVSKVIVATMLVAAPLTAQAGGGKTPSRSVLDQVLFDADAGSWRRDINKDVKLDAARKAPAPPARFFTISNVLARDGAVPVASARLAALNSTVKSDAPGAGLRSDITDEPFGLVLFRAPEGAVAKKWHNLEAEIKADIESIENCRRDSEACSIAAVSFNRLTERSIGSDGLARIQVINSAFNDAIRYQSDYDHHGVVDRWSAPLATLGSGTGDCEDYAVAKYVALRQLGLAAADLKVLLVLDTFSNQDHAVLGVRHDGNWILLDNRWSQMIESNASPRFMPLFSLGEDGAKLFTSRYADSQATSTEFDPSPASDESGACGDCGWPTPFLQ